MIIQVTEFESKDGMAFSNETNRINDHDSIEVTFRGTTARFSLNELSSALVAFDALRSREKAEYE